MGITDSELEALKVIITQNVLIDDSLMGELEDTLKGSVGQLMVTDILNRLVDVYSPKEMTTIE